MHIFMTNDDTHFHNLRIMYRLLPDEGFITTVVKTSKL